MPHKELWSQIDDRQLAQFVIPETPDSFKLSDSINPLGLRHWDERKELVKEIYETLRAKNIKYDTELFNSVENTQRIRTSKEILENPKVGTCLDLAVLFCGICLAYDLLPILIVLEGHALAAVSMLYNRDEYWNEKPTNTNKNREEERRLFQDKSLSDLEQLQKLINSDNFLPIECTGFASTQMTLPENMPEGSGRNEEGFFSFERAIEAGKEQINKSGRALKFALDVAIAHEYWKKQPYDDYNIFKLFYKAPISLSQKIRVKHFESLVEEKTKNFVGREFIFQSINNFLTEANFPSGYIVIRGEPGIGKSSLIAQFIKTRDAVHHFNSVLMGIRSPKDFLENICAQLIIRYKLNHSTLPPEAGKDSGLLSQLLAEIANQRQQQPVVILVDALDEAEDTGLPPGANRLFLPEDLPEGIFFIVTSREEYDYRLNVTHRQDIYLRDDDPENLKDVRLYIHNYVQEHRTKMYPHIEQWGVSQDEFVDVITEKSEGNFMYLFHVLHDIRDGKLTQNNVDSIDNLPKGLQSYYQRHWREMKEQDSEKFERYYEPVVCQLAVAREPVSVNQLFEWTKLPPIRIKEVIHDWREFFNEFAPETGEHLYRIYHASFQTFLREDIGLQPYEEIVVQTAFNKIEW